MFESFDNIHFVIQTIPIFGWEHDSNASTSVTINLSTPLDIRSRSKTCIKQIQKNESIPFDSVRNVKPRRIQIFDDASYFEKVEFHE